MIRLERVPAQSGFWHRERLQVVRTFPITPFTTQKPASLNDTSPLLYLPGRTARPLFSPDELARHFALVYFGRSAAGLGIH